MRFERLAWSMGVGVWCLVAGLGAPAQASAQTVPSEHQQHHSPQASASPGMPMMMGSPGPSMDMMGTCMQRHQAMMRSIDQLNVTLDQAKRSGDPARMRAAIDQAQRQLAAMQRTMSDCHQMMRNMPGMSPGGGSPGPSPQPSPRRSM